MPPQPGVPSLDAEAVNITITGGALNITACDIPDCVGNYDLRESNFSLVGRAGLLTSGVCDYTVRFPSPPTFSTLTLVEAPFFMTVHLDAINTRTNQPTTFDMSGTGLVTGLFGFNRDASPPFGGKFVEVSARYDFTVIPEPPTILLLTTGLMALTAAGWRQRLRGAGIAVWRR